ncbi:MAG TPA: FapA family protein [Thermosynergistes sp.]|nr:FapA family protein [Thermosynergistes sp.]
MTARPFHFSVEEDGLYLQADPEERATLAQIVAFLKERGVSSFDGGKIEAVLEERPKEPVRIADKPTVEAKAKIEVDISDDELKAFIRVTPPLDDRDWPTIDELKRALEEAGVEYGIDEGALEEIAREHVEDEWVLVAKGNPPKDGEDAQIVLKVELGRPKPKEADADRVDMRELGAVVNVLHGQELAEKIPLKQGEDGTSVKGKPLKARQGKDRQLPKGKNTEVSDDGLHLLAAMDGHVSIREGKIDVLPVYEIKGDVDYSVGNVDFVGTVIVRGTVREGFVVMASGDIQVDGAVEGAKLKSGGSIVVKGGVSGMGKGELSAQGDIIVRYAEQATLRSGSNVVAERALLHSLVYARSEVQVSGGSGKKGTIAGGKIYAGSEVVCDELGSKMETRTEVQVGTSPELIEEKRTKEGDLAESLNKLQEVEKNLEYLKKLEEMGMLDEEKRGMLVALTRAKFQLRAHVESLQKQLAEIEATLYEFKGRARVRVKGYCYPGVVVSIKGVSYVVKDTLQFVSFVYDEGEVRIRSFEG